MNIIQKPFALIDTGKDLHVLLQDGKSEALDDQFGEITWILPAPTVKMLRERGRDSAVQITRPATRILRLTQHKLVKYFQLIESNKTEEANKLIEVPREYYGEWNGIVKGGY